MSRRAKWLWMASAIIAFTLALCYSAYYWKIRWKDVELSRILLTFLFIVVGGLLIGNIPFHKMPYRTKIMVTIPLVSIALSFYIVWTIFDNKYGLTDEYNYFTAKQDLKKGKVQIITHGLMYFPIEFEKGRAVIDSEFGFTTVWAGCIIPNNGWLRYNNVIWNYLDERNGKGWQKKYAQKIDSLRKVTNSF